MLFIKKRLSFLIVLLFFVPFIYGQTYNEEQSNEETITNNDDLSRSIFANFGIGTETDPRNSLIRGNTVFLTQIGDFNTASIITETNASEINISQNGDVNDVSINYVANTAIADLIQDGNNNKISDFVRDRSADISLDLVQEGDGLLFVRQGANTLTKSLKFRQSEASPTLIIRSYY